MKFSAFTRRKSLNPLSLPAFMKIFRVYISNVLDEFLHRIIPGNEI